MPAQFFCRSTMCYVVYDRYKMIQSSYRDNSRTLNISSDNAAGVMP